MQHPIHKVTSFKKLAPYTLCIRFADNTEQPTDFRPILAGALYGPLQDLVVFEHGPHRPGSVYPCLAEWRGFRPRRVA